MQLEFCDTTKLEEIESYSSQRKILADRNRARGKLSLKTRAENLPDRHAFFDRFGSVVCQLQFDVQRLSQRKNAPHSCQRHRVIRKLSEVIRRHVRFWIPKRVEHADEGSSLAQVVMQIEHLIATETGCAKIRFDLLFICVELKISRVEDEVFVSLEQAVGL